MAKKKKSKKGLSTPFIPLFVISLLLLLCLIYVSYTTFGLTFKKGNTSQEIPPKPLNIQKTIYELPPITI